ncbi:hypothetical protein IFM89_011181 [Coptis chinensis]|uniref:Protein S-acyltransferase 10 n=1 Tax=Coptis chinensis TaxID=261450 RepID=A0A835LVL1_9MAGN|nr:hypothetical protein IFM89_011181 [Coptis chinensis]
MMTRLDLCSQVRETWDRSYERFYELFPCMADPGRRSSLALKVALVCIHLVFVGVIFLFDNDLIDKTRKEAWYTAIYLLLLVAALAQYFFTSGSSPGYVLDAMRVANETHFVFSNMSATSNIMIIKQRQSASRKNGSFIIAIEGSHSGRSAPGANYTPWTKLVMDMYPPGSSIRFYVNVHYTILASQPLFVVKREEAGLVPTVISCRWYILEETALTIWTGVLYISYLKAKFARAWWKDGIVILFFSTLSICLVFLLLLLIFHSYLVLTNQTTYELVRRRRIPYLRGIPERLYPFSRGICKNVYNFCCARSSIYNVEPLPTAQELEFKLKPYTCCDVLSCRCC